MAGKRLGFENGDVVDDDRDGEDCDHDIVDRPGANPVCINCGAINPKADDA